MTDSGKLSRKLVALLIAIIIYYVIHEGAHLVFSLIIGTFQKINYMFPGIQIQADTAHMSNGQIAAFCFVGAMACLTFGYIFLISIKHFMKLKSNFVRAIAYYVTIALLLTDPIYLSLLCGFFGGGDMNGIKLIMPESVGRILFGIILAINIFLVVKIAYPGYRAAFIERNNR